MVINRFLSPTFIPQNFGLATFLRTHFTCARAAFRLQSEAAPSNFQDIYLPCRLRGQESRAGCPRHSISGSCSA